MVKSISFILVNVIFLFGCVLDRPITKVSRALGCFYKDIKELNPHFPEEAIPPGIQFVNLPPGTSVPFWTFFSAWKTEMEGKQ
jgi:hypothetical protein